MKTTLITTRLLAGCATGLMLSATISTTAAYSAPQPILTQAGIATAKAVKAPWVLGTTKRLPENVLRLRVSSNRSRIQVASWIGEWNTNRDDAWVQSVRVVRGVGTIDLQAETTRVAVRVPPQGKTAGSRWREVKVIPRSSIYYPTETINTCEQLDRAVIAQWGEGYYGEKPSYGVSDFAYFKEQAQNNIWADRARNYIINLPSPEVCRRPVTRPPASTTNASPMFTLGTPKVTKCTVVPLDSTAPEGWTPQDLANNTGSDKKGWLVEADYPVSGQQKYLDVDHWNVAFGTNRTRFLIPGQEQNYDPNYGKLVRAGSWKWLNGAEYVPATYGDTLQVTTQVPNSVADVSAGEWKFGWEGKWYWSVLPKYATQKVNIGSPKAGWSSTVKLTKFVPATGNLGEGKARMGVSTAVNVTPRANKWHGANYLPAINLKFDSGSYFNQTNASTLSIRSTMYGVFDTSRWDDKDYWFSWGEHRDDVEGLEASENWDLTTLQSVCDQVNAK